jgi:hypothetical protein
MTATIMLIRHAEKARSGGAESGVNRKGAQDPKGLSVRGWQRAGALVRFFAPISQDRGGNHTARPAAIFAAAPSAGRSSKRPAQTVRPLAQALDLPVRQDVAADGPIHKLVSAAAAIDGPVLVCWCSDSISDIASLLLDDDVPSWPKDRFDLVWVFKRARRGWLLIPMPQLLLPGDRPYRGPSPCIMRR